MARFEANDKVRKLMKEQHVARNHRQGDPYPENPNRKQQPFSRHNAQDTYDEFAFYEDRYQRALIKDHVASILGRRLPVPPNEDVDKLALEHLFQQHLKRRSQRMEFPTRDLQLLKNEYATLLSEVKIDAKSGPQNLPEDIVEGIASIALETQPPDKRLERGKIYETWDPAKRPKQKQRRGEQVATADRRSSLQDIRPKTVLEDRLGSLELEITKSRTCSSGKQAKNL